MSETYTHSCIKCKEKYKDNEPDDYYCEPCNEERKRIAKEIDEKVKPSKVKVKSNLEIYDENLKNGRFVSSKVFGI